MLDSWKHKEKEIASRETNPKYPLASRPTSNTIVKVRELQIGGNEVIIIAGPCSVETRAQVLETARSVKQNGAVMLRGGAYKPRTSPYDFQGLGVDALKLLREAGDTFDLPIVTEVISEEAVETVCDYADMLQVGARNMQNFALLKKLSKVDRPILFKRSASATIKEYLSAAEYLLHGGNENVVLCERGIKSFDSSLRNTLDLASVALLKELTHLPIIVDPSHATGKRSLVSPCSKAALAAGADGLIIEVHPDPKNALSDNDQQLTFEGFSDLMSEIRSPLRPVYRSRQPAIAV